MTITSAREDAQSYLDFWLREETTRKQESSSRTVELNGIQLTVPPHVFNPDPALTNSTPLFLKTLRSYPFEGRRVLDLGTGSGVLAIYAARHGASVVATDINEKIIDGARLNAQRNNVRIEFLVSSLFQNVDQKFDYIFANGPIAAEAWSSEMLGDNTIESFGDTLFREYRRHLDQDGVMFMTFASFGNIESFYRLATRYNISQRITSERKFGATWTAHEISGASVEQDLPVEACR
jgi:release factor glutamine methyltransferase